MIHFETKLFAANIKYKLDNEQLGLREAAKEIGIHASTLSRLQNGKVPDVLTFYLVYKWMGAFSMDYYFTKTKPKKGDKQK